MTLTSDLHDLPPHELLSEKEARALELVADQFTTKEIARELGITPRAVEERLRSAREKMNAPDRRSAARLFLQSRETCGITTGGSSTVGNRDRFGSQSLRDLPDSALFTLEDSSGIFFDKATGPTFLEAFDVRFGKPGRLVAIVLLAAALALVGAAAVSIAVTLGEIV